MTVVAMLRLLRFGLGSGVVGACLAGCAAPAEDEAGATEAASTSGGGSGGPLEVGTYDGDQGTLFVTNHMGGQYGTMVTSTTNGLASCEAAVEMRNSRATLDDPRCALLKFNATSGAGELSASGNLLDDGRWPVYSDRLRRRRENALVGTYVGRSSSRRVELTIESSNDDGLTFSLTLDGRPVASHSVALKAMTTRTRREASGLVHVPSVVGRTDGCTVQLTVHRRNKRYGIGIASWGTVTDGALCPIVTEPLE